MPDNKIQIIFEAVDNGVKKTVDNIKSGFAGFVEQAGTALAAFGTAATVALAAFSIVSKELEKIVKLSEKRPELFTPEQLDDVKAYAEAVNKVTDNFEELKIKALSPIMGGLADDLERLNDANQSGRGGKKPIQDLADDYDQLAEAALAAGDAVIEGGQKQLSMMEQLVGATEEATAKIIYNNLLQKLSVDGITEAEMEMATQAGLALGRLDERSVETAEKINDLTDRVIDGKLKVEDLGNALNNLQDRTINVQVNATGSGLAMIGGEGATKAAVGIKAKKAGGGPVSGGSSYVVGEAGPEIFSPGNSGSVSSNDSLIMAIERSKIDEARLARLIVTGMLKGMAQQ